MKYLPCTTIDLYRGVSLTSPFARSTAAAPICIRAKTSLRGDQGVDDGGRVGVNTKTQTCESALVDDTALWPATKDPLLKTKVRVTQMSTTDVSRYHQMRQLQRPKFPKPVKSRTLMTAKPSLVACWMWRARRRKT